MPKYLLTYHGAGDMPADKAAIDKEMAAWGAWMEGLGSALVDGGNPTSVTKTIAASGGVSDGGGANPANGYSIIQANNIDAAVKLASGCPHRNSGGSIEVSELIDMS